MLGNMSDILEERFGMLDGFESREVETGETSIFVRWSGSGSPIRGPKTAAEQRVMLSSWVDSDIELGLPWENQPGFRNSIIRTLHYRSAGHLLECFEERFHEGRERD